MMKAIVTTRQGAAEGLRLQDVPRPSPRDNELLVRVHAATVTRGDVVLRNFHPVLFLPMRLFGVRRKRIPGHEWAGVVEAAGREAMRFKPGDRVFGTTTGLSVGANAEYVCLPESGSSGVLDAIPGGLTFAQAAALPVGGMTALQILRRANIQPGQSVLVNGASGSVGSYAVQLARHFGADVTGVCSGRNAELVRSLGAGRIIDYTQQEFAAAGVRYDVIFDAAGKSSPAHSAPALAEGGLFLTTNTSTKESLDDLRELGRLVSEGHITPFIDRRYPLDQVAEAHRYVESGRKRGNVVITVVDE